MTPPPRWRCPTRGRPSTWRSRRRTPRAWPPRVRNAGAVFVGAYAPVSLGDSPGGLQPRPADGRHRAAHRRAVRPFLPAGDPTWWSARPPRLPWRPRTSMRSAEPRISPPTWPRCGSACRAARPRPLLRHGALAVSARTRPVAGAEAADAGFGPAPAGGAAGAAGPGGPGAVRGAATRRAGPAQHQREPLPAAARVLRSRRSPTPWPHAAGSLNRHPDRDADGAARRPLRPPISGTA